MRTEIDNWKHVVVFVEGACVNGSPGCLLIRKPIILGMGRFSINTPLRSGRKNYQRPYQSRARAFYYPFTRHFSVIRAGERIPPCGVPVVVRLKDSRSMTPALSHSFRIARSIGMCDNNHSCEIPSKQLWMSPSKIHCGEFERQSSLKHCSTASATDRFFRKP